ncbi:zinc transporter ZntB [Candidatus Sumerlaeota bacterium]|nr:zinc transporter ZntB [Candidatus Sumerlaeota bacterium]
MSDRTGLVSAILLDGQGGGRELPWPETPSDLPEGMTPWLHLDRMSENVQRWVRREARLDPLVCEALFAEETRPRVARKGDGLLVILRGVNLNPGEDPEDMISIRLWIDAHRIISLRSNHIMAAADIRERIAASEGPRGPGDFLVALADGLMDRMAPVLASLEDRLDGMEEEILVTPTGEIRSKLSELRRDAVALRRYLAPQREALNRLQTEQVPWLTDLHREQLHEIADLLTRHIELLDSARDHAAVTQDELTNLVAEQMNQRMYGLSVVAVIFLPLGFLTGLLGINVAGIPGMDYQGAFAIVCAILLVVALFVVGILKHRRWF